MRSAPEHLEEAVFGTPMGSMRIRGTTNHVTALTWVDDAPDPSPPTSGLLQDAIKQISEYFAGTRTEFDLPLKPAGGQLHQQVFDAMLAIPFGETRTYGEIAKELSVAAQPIGQACGANPIPVIIPCHRVLGASSLGGFSAPGGVETKVALLKHEGAAGLLI